jgi:tripartite-type tricarboxylate transporter receptor subunit TctC
MKNIPQQLCALLGGLLVSACVWAQGASGYPGYEDVTLNMLLAPAGTPKEIVAKIHADVAKAFAQPELVARFVERSIELVASPSPEDFGQLIRSEVARLGKVAREAGIKAE